MVHRRKVLACGDSTILLLRDRARSSALTSYLSRDSSIVRSRIGEPDLMEDLHLRTYRALVNMVELISTRRPWAFVDTATAIST